MNLALAGTLGAGRKGGGRTPDLDGHGAYVSAMPGGGTGQRGYRIGAEEAAGGQLVSFHATQDPISSDSHAPPLGADAYAGVCSEQVGVRRLTPVECERLQGWPDGWTLPEGPSLADAPTWLDEGFVADETCPPPDSPRLAAAGDGVTAPVAEWIGRRLLALDPEGP